MEFTGKTAIITGGASGMGLLCGQELAKKGANVVLTDVNAEAVEAKAGEIRAGGGKAIGVRADVRKYEELESAVRKAVETFGQIDISIYAAGGAPGRIFSDWTPFPKRKFELLDWGLDVNLKGALFLSRLVIENMAEHKSGVIINIASIDGVTGSGAVEYSTAKSGMFGMTKSLALCGAPYNVRACCVVPGPVLTRAAMANMKTPLGRAAEPIEVVDFILYLCSEKAAFITGSSHLIDGGRACGAQD